MFQFKCRINVPPENLPQKFLEGLPELCAGLIDRQSRELVNLLLDNVVKQCVQAAPAPQYDCPQGVGAHHQGELLVTNYGIICS